MRAVRLLGMLLITGLAGCTSEQSTPTTSKAAETWPTLTAPRPGPVVAWRREADGVWRIAMEAFLSLEAGK